MQLKGVSHSKMKQPEDDNAVKGAERTKSQGFTKKSAPECG